MPLDLDQLEALPATLSASARVEAIKGNDYVSAQLDQASVAIVSLIQAARRVERLERLVRGFLYYARIRTVDGVTCYEHGSHTELVRDADALLLDIARPTLKESP